MALYYKMTSSLKTWWQGLKLRWILAILFMIIPLLIIILININQTLYESKIMNYLSYLNVLPILIFGRVIEQIPCDGLGCIILFGVIILGVIILFYGGLGYLIGYLIEKRKKK